MTIIVSESEANHLIEGAIRLCGLFAVIAVVIIACLFLYCWHHDKNVKD